MLFLAHPFNLKYALSIFLLAACGAGVAFAILKWLTSREKEEYESHPPKLGFFVKQPSRKMRRRSHSVSARRLQQASSLPSIESEHNASNPSRRTMGIVAALKHTIAEKEAKCNQTEQQLAESQESMRRMQQIVAESNARNGELQMINRKVCCPII